MALEIEPTGDKSVGFDISGVPAREGLIRLMVEAGQWAGMRARPFGRVADPVTAPDALFLTAMESTPGAPDVSAVIGEFSEWFRLGFAALPVLSDEPVWLCHAPGMRMAEIEGFTARLWRAVSGGAGAARIGLGPADRDPGPARGALLAASHRHQLWHGSGRGDLWRAGAQLCPAGGAGLPCLFLTD